MPVRPSLRACFPPLAPGGAITEWANGCGGWNSEAHSHQECAQDGSCLACDHTVAMRAGFLQN